MDQLSLRCTVKSVVRGCAMKEWEMNKALHRNEVTDIMSWDICRLAHMYHQNLKEFCTICWPGIANEIKWLNDAM